MLSEVDRHGTADGLKRVEQAQQEEHQRALVLADLKVRPVAAVERLERPVLGRAAELKPTVRIVGGQGSDERVAEMRRPVALDGENAGDDREGLPWRLLDAAVDERPVRPVQPSHRARLLRRVLDHSAVELGPDLEDGEDALGWDVALVLLLEQQRAEVSVVDDEVDLLAAVPVRVEDEGVRDLVALRQELSEQAMPCSLAEIRTDSNLVAVCASSILKEAWIAAKYTPRPARSLLR